MKSLLKVADLHVDFHTQGKVLHALRGIDFELLDGEILGMVGESGSGKSVASKAVLQLLPQRSCSIRGNIWYQGLDLLTASPKEMRSILGREISMVFQDAMSGLNPTLKIGYQIAEGLRRHAPQLSRKEVSDRVLEMMHNLGISEPELRSQEYPHTLSGGMRQRVMIALALITQPRLLIADEPTTSLDVTTQGQILSLLKEVQTRYCASLLLITHDWRLIASVCDRVVVMYAGNVVETASVEELFTRPKHPYTERLLAAIPHIDFPKDQPLPFIEGLPPSPFQTFQGCSFESRCAYRQKTCREIAPKLSPVGSQHLVSCLQYESLDATERS